MAHSLFISDLHLAADRPEIIAQFFEFLQGAARAAERLYVLGDLFEFWAGDDDIENPLNRSVAAAFAALRAHGTSVLFLHGNRDFLVGPAFAAASGAELLPETAVVDLYGTRTLLMHGDTLCTDDVEYQKFRAYARNPQTQAAFLSLPLHARRAKLAGLREQSENAKQAKSADIMDVNTTAVEAQLRSAGYPRLIHGHTHRPARHVHHVDGHTCERWVLADWYERASYLRCDAAGCTPVALAPAS